MDYFSESDDELPLYLRNEVVSDTDGSSSYEEEEQPTDVDVCFLNISLNLFCSLGISL